MYIYTYMYLHTYVSIYDEYIYVDMIWTYREFKGRRASEGDEIPPRGLGLSTTDSWCLGGSKSPWNEPLLWTQWGPHNKGRPSLQPDSLPASPDVHNSFIQEPRVHTKAPKSIRHPATLDNAPNLLRIQSANKGTAFRGDQTASLPLKASTKKKHFFFKRRLGPGGRPRCAWMPSGWWLCWACTARPHWGKGCFSPAMSSGPSWASCEGPVDHIWQPGTLCCGASSFGAAVARVNLHHQRFPLAPAYSGCTHMQMPRQRHWFRVLTVAVLSPGQGAPVPKQGPSGCLSAPFCHLIRLSPAEVLPGEPRRLLQGKGAARFPLARVMLKTPWSLLVPCPGATQPSLGDRNLPAKGPQQWQSGKLQGEQSVPSSSGGMHTLACSSHGPSSVLWPDAPQAPANTALNWMFQQPSWIHFDWKQRASAGGPFVEVPALFLVICLGFSM